MPTENKLKLNGGEFLLKESLSNEIFTPEDFSEEQLMMKQTIVDFMDREIWPDKMKYEEKNYDLTVIPLAINKLFKNIRLITTCRHIKIMKFNSVA